MLPRSTSDAPRSWPRVQGRSAPGVRLYLLLMIRMSHYLISIPRHRFMSQWNSPHPIVLSGTVGGAFDHFEMNDVPPAGISLFPWKLPGSENLWWSRNLRLGEVACALNHLACWRDAARDTADAAVFFEDDAVFDESLLGELTTICAELAELDPTWGLLYLGRQQIGQDGAVKGLFVRAGFSYCTYGYVLRSSALRLLLGYNFERHIMPVDEFLPATYVSHPRQDIRSLIVPQLVAYALQTPRVSEGDERLFGSDTESSREIRL
jgi:glycosyl transferase, family 25